MTPFRLPNELVRDLISYCLREGAGGPRGDAMIEAVVSTVSEVPIVGAHVYDDSRGSSRYARIVVRSEHVRQFESIFPDALRLKDSAPGLAVFRLRESRAPMAD